MNKRLKNYLLLTIGWIFAVVLFVTIRYVGLGSIEYFKEYDLSHINHTNLFVRAIILGWIMGSFFYLMDLAFDRPFIRQRPYWEIIFVQAGGNLALVMVTFVSVLLLETIQEGRELEWASAQSRLFSSNIIVVLVYVTLVSILFNFLKQVNRKFGPGNLWKLIIGMYHHPREEERIFMFLDMKGSTTHAEHLGHVVFSRLIQDCFIDLSVVIDHHAQVYQYIGDEVVLFWDVDAGLREANCINAYYLFTDRLKDRAEYYQAEYGLLPEFKAGVNIGSATVLEVGEIKREIAYLGDVLNTAARIQGQCNEFGKDLLVSEPLFHRLNSIPDQLSLKPIGEVQLRGKVQSIGIYGVERQ